MATATDLPAVLTAAEVAQALRISKPRVRQLVREGHLPAFRLTARGDYRFRAEDIRRVLEREAKSP